MTGDKRQRRCKTPTRGAARRAIGAVRDRAAQAGCTCRPDVSLRSIEPLEAEVRHDRHCPLVDAGSVAYVNDGSLAAVADAAIAARAVAVTIANGDVLVIVPEGVEPPATLVAACDVARAERHGTPVRFFRMRDDVVADLERQLRGGR